MDHYRSAAFCRLYAIPHLDAEDFLKMTDEELIQLLKGDSVLNRARRELSAARDQIEQAKSWVEMRELEFEAVRKIAKVLGVEL